MLKYPRSRINPMFLYPYPFTFSTMNCSCDTSLMLPGYFSYISVGCVAGPDLAVEAAPGVVFADGLPQAKREKATHGFGPGHPAENCLLAVRGRGIREGVTLPEMPMRDVAPTLAGLMGVRLPQAEGTDHSRMMKMDEKWYFQQNSTVI